MSAGRNPAIAAALLLGALPGCATGGATVGSSAAAGPEAGYVILPGDLVAALLRQCSRATPEPGEASWQPAARDIVAFEALLPAALLREEPGRNWSAFPQGWKRQYVGIVRQGRRFIYGNFVPADLPGPVDDGPIMICDGGPSFFGAEYDVAARSISHIAFNGMA